MTKVPARTRRHIPTLEFLHKSKPEIRKQIISGASKELIECICDWTKNVLNGNIPLSKYKRKRLSAHKCSLRRLVRKDIPIRHKKRMFNQNGGMFMTLLSSILPVVTGLLGNLFKK